MKNKNKDYRFYYISGGILLVISILTVIMGFSLTLMFKDNQVVGYVSVGICALGLLLVFFSIYLLKKANFLKLNTKLADIKKDHKNK